MNQTECMVSARIKRISNALDRRVTLELEEMDLTASQGLVLGYLHRRRGEDVYPVEVGRHFGLSHPTVTAATAPTGGKSGFVSPTRPRTAISGSGAGFWRPRRPSPRPCPPRSRVC